MYVNRSLGCRMYEITTLLQLATNLLCQFRLHKLSCRGWDTRSLATTITLGESEEEEEVYSMAVRPRAQVPRTATQQQWIPCQFQPQPYSYETGVMFGDGDGKQQFERRCMSDFDCHVPERVPLAFCRGSCRQASQQYRLNICCARCIFIRFVYSPVRYTVIIAPPYRLPLRATIQKSSWFLFRALPSPFSLLAFASFPHRCRTRTLSHQLGYDGRLCATGKDCLIEFYDLRKAGKPLGSYSECHTDAVTQVITNLRFFLSFPCQGI